MNPRSHSHDPITSHEAESRHTASGRRQRNADLVYDLATKHPASTAIELWDSAGAEIQSALKEPQEVRRRLTDLASVGRVQQGPPRVCRVRGTRQVTWSPVCVKKQVRLFALEGEEYR